MKYHVILLILLMGMLAGSCGKEDEPRGEVSLPISETYMPTTVAFDRSDTDFLDKCREFNDKLLVVTSSDELPDDPIGFTNAYRKIDYKNYTLLIAYKLHSWPIETYRNSFVRNRADNTYTWTISLGSSLYDDQDQRVNLKFTRFAIEVRKLPPDTDYKLFWGMYDLDWDWDE